MNLHRRSKIATTNVSDRRSACTIRSFSKGAPLEKGRKSEGQVGVIKPVGKGETEKRQQLRQNATCAEERLWSHLNGRGEVAPIG